MEERKVAAIVLPIVAIIVIFFTVILPEIHHTGIQTLSFKSCTVNFKYSNIISESDINRISQNKLALCLCSLYKNKPDTTVANRIIKIYRQYDLLNNTDSLYLNKTPNLDSILKNKAAVFDTTVVID